MALSVPQDWTGTGGRDDLQINVQPTAGNWLICTIAYRTLNGTSPLASIADMARNWWLLCGSVFNATSGTRVEVWACPKVDYATFPLDIVYAAVAHIHADDVGSVAVNVAEVAGFVNGFPTVVSVTPGTATGTGLAIAAPAPGKNVLYLAAAATDNASLTVTPPGIGWGALTGAARSGPDVWLSPAWTTAGTAVTASWSTTSSVHWTGLVVALAETGTVWSQPNANWPATKLQLGKTVGQETPLPRVPWTDETARFEAIQATRGVQYELGAPQAGESTLTLRNFDDGVTAQAAGDYDIYSPYQLLMAWAGKIYPVSSGWIEEWARRWVDPHHGYMDARGVDAIATLVQQVPTAIQGEVLRHDPYCYWPLSDPSGSLNAINISGRSLSLLSLQRSKYGSAAASADFGAQTDLMGDAGSGWQQQGLLVADTKRGYALTGADEGFPAVSGGITIFGTSFFPASSDPANVQPSSVTLCILRSRDSRNNSVIKVSMEGSSLGKPTITVWDKDTAAATATGDPTGQGAYLGQWIPWCLRFDRTSWTFERSNSAWRFAGAADLPDTFYSILVGGEADAYWNGNSGNMIHAHIALFDRRLSDDETDQLMTKATTGWNAKETAETADTRMQRFMAISGSTAPRAFDHAASSLSGDPDQGTLSDRLSLYAQQDAGLLFGDGAGYLRFRSQSRTDRQSVRWVLGDNTGAGEIPFQGDAAPTSGPTYLFNVVNVDNTGEIVFGQPGVYYFTYTDVARSAVDIDSASRYGPRPTDRATHFHYASAAWTLGQWLLAQYSAPRPRFETVTVDASAYPAAWPLVLGIEVGDLVTVVRRPVGQTAVTVQCRVMQVRHTFVAGKGQTRGEVALTLGAAFPSVLLLGHPTKAVLGDNTIGWG